MDFHTSWNYMMILVTKKTTTDVCAKNCGRNVTFAVAIFARFWPDSLCGFAFLVGGGGLWRLLLRYLAFAHFFPCRGQQSQQRERDWFLFENFSNLALMMECACSILKITTNIALLQDLELHSQRKLLLTRFCQLVSLITIVKWEISWPNLMVLNHFMKSPNRWSKLTMFFRTSLVQHSFFQSQLGTNLLKGPGQKRWSREPIRTDSNCELWC